MLGPLEMLSFLTCHAKFWEEKRKSRESKASAEAATLNPQESGSAEAKMEADPEEPQKPQEPQEPQH